MSVFTTTTTVPEADVLIALIFLSILILKVVTLEQINPVFQRFGKIVNMSLYSVGLLFSVTMLQMVIVI